MKAAGYGLAAIGIIIVLVGVLNHYVLKTNVVAHFSTILGVVGVVVVVVGLAMTFMGGKKAA